MKRSENSIVKNVPTSPTKWNFLMLLKITTLFFFSMLSKGLCSELHLLGGSMIQFLKVQNLVPSKYNGTLVKEFESKQYLLCFAFSSINQNHSCTLERDPSVYREHLRGTSFQRDSKVFWFRSTCIVSMLLFPVLKKKEHYNR